MITEEQIRYLVPQIDRLLESAKDQYYQLAWIVGGTWRERTIFLKEIAELRNFDYIALSLPLSHLLLERSSRDRPMVLLDYTSTLIVNHEKTAVVLDQIEILFDPALHADPLRLIQTFARSRLILAAWPGRFENNFLTYASPGHPEYYSRKADDCLIFSIEVDE